jgi:hypothetical protein
VTTAISYNATTSDFAILCTNNNNHPITITLPPANKGPQLIYIVQQNAPAPVVTVASQGTDTIQGVSTGYLLQYANNFVTLLSDGLSNWNVLSTNSFQSMIPGLVPSITDYFNSPSTAHNFEIPAGVAFVAAAGSTYSAAGTYSFRKSFSPYIVRNALQYVSTPTEGIFVGDPSGHVYLSLSGSQIYNNNVPWEDLVLDTSANYNSPLVAGKLIRNDTNYCFQGGVVDNGNTVRAKSFCQLWETGSVNLAGAAADTAQSFAINFANAMKDAAYFVVFEYDDAEAGGEAYQISIENQIGLKTNTGFTLYVTAGAMGLTGFEIVTWYAVRYGV